MSGAERGVNPLAIVQMQNGSGGNGAPHFRLLPVKSGGDEHAHAHHSGVGDFEPNFCGAEIGIENRQNIIDASFEDLIGIGIQADVRILADVYGIEIIFVNVTDDPDIRKIGDGEGIGRTQALHARCVGDLLVGDHARDGRDDVDDPRRMVFIDAEKLQLCGCGIQIGLGVLAASSACSRALLAIAPLS